MLEDKLCLLWPLRACCRPAHVWQWPLLQASELEMSSKFWPNSLRAVHSRCTTRGTRYALTPHASSLCFGNRSRCTADGS